MTKLTDHHSLISEKYYFVSTSGALKKHIFSNKYENLE